MPRPLLDDTKKREICAIVAVGCPQIVAARYVGCSPITIRRAALHDPEFAANLARSRRHQEVQQLKNISQAAGEARHWRAAAWILERKFPDRYAARGPRVITLSDLRHTIRALLAILAEEIDDPPRITRIFERVQRLVRRLDTPPDLSDDDTDDTDDSETAPPTSAADRASSAEPDGVTADPVYADTDDPTADPDEAPPDD